MGKPQYTIPTMKQIKALPHNGCNVVSTFSGCGGSSLGYKMAGYKVLWANEFVPAAQEVYRLNHPDTILNTSDIRTVTGNDILSAINMKPGELDILDGSPPCASFSTAGKREKGWGKTKAYSDKEQRSDDLFFEFVRILTDVQPKTFVAENVSGLIRGTAKGYFIEILQALRGAGYNVKAKLLKASYLGVPQARERLIFVGVRNDLQMQPTHPTPLPYEYSVRDAIDLTTLHPELDVSKLPIGKYWREIPVGGHHKVRFGLTRVHPDKPCPTITAMAGLGVATVHHPYQCRVFSIDELKALSSFPSDFVLTGKYSQQAERIGRAVPPVMMSHIATSIYNNILSEAK